MASFSRFQTCQFREEKPAGSVSLGIFLCLVAIYFGLVASTVLPPELVDRVTLGAKSKAADMLPSYVAPDTRLVELEAKLDTILEVLNSDSQLSSSSASTSDSAITEKPVEAKPPSDVATSSGEPAQTSTKPGTIPTTRKKNKRRKSIFRIDPSLAE